MNTKQILKPTWKDLRDFLNTKDDTQLSRKISLSISDEGAPYTVDSIEELLEDHINPSDEVWEPKSDYLEGGQYYNEENSHIPADELDEFQIVGPAGFIFLSAE